VKFEREKKLYLFFIEEIVGPVLSYEWSSAPRVLTKNQTRRAEIFLTITKSEIKAKIRRVFFAGDIIFM
jgi:hypothetical protein